MPAFRETLRVFADANLSPDAQSALLARVAIEARDRVISDGSAPPRWATFVDDHAASDESGARRSIEYDYNALPDVVSFTLAFLRGRAPAASGRFRDSFWVSVDGRFMLAAEVNPEQIPHTAEILIGNTQPYNRKIDVQFNGRVALRFSVPAGLYIDAVRAVKGRFGNIMASVKRVYDIDFPGKYKLRQHQRRHTGRRAGAIVRSAGEFGQSPAIVIRQVT